ncbi:hypothetical protein Ple7327_4441 [Pleurocapsa sp. PCC 7327]|uniref:Npun_F0494 family protein n=1 Tax=Pleurocapsa sp. PCC 7327 TaxID=118163 RepID=UPI00029FB2DA|nr:Npun_F0494 family protein [Pleurocapsa sp. PCC 7327]AFY79546.1 hypothetical protein Ple7327_4441 [Pleurocapsa sp. PCC 7327]
MTSTREIQSISYTNPTFKRAERALCCSTFKLALFVAMQNQSVPLSAIALPSGVRRGYTQKPLSERRAERDLMWLIDVGLLRREVDGQGITDSFRLTPLGRQLTDKWQKQGGILPQPSWIDRLIDTFNRWLRLPF